METGLETCCQAHSKAGPETAPSPFFIYNLYVVTMVRYRFRAIAGIFLLSAAQCALAFQNEPKGFRGIDWDTDFANVEGEMFLAEDTQIKFYTRRDDKMTIGGAELARLTYGFYEGKFGYVFIHTKLGPGNQSALRDAFFPNLGSAIDLIASSSVGSGMGQPRTSRSNAAVFGTIVLA